MAEELTPGLAREVLARGIFGEGFEYIDGSEGARFAEEEEEERSGGGSSKYDAERMEEARGARDGGIHPSRM